MSSGSDSPIQVPGEGITLLEALLDGIPADELTVWQHREDEGDLLAIHNPVNPGMIGLSQPLSRGLIPQVLMTGLPLLEPDVGTRREHDPSINLRTGQTTRSLMAAPITLGADIVGVVSAVQLAGGTVGREFNDRDLASLERAARRLGELMAPSGGEDTRI
jgi:hypothetical protein